MLAITVEFLHRTFRGASADDTALMGADVDSGEWPPSPARLFSALVAADGTGDRQRVTDGTELAVLEAAGPPTILADPRSRTLATPLNGRFVVADSFHKDQKTRQTGSVQEYVGRTAALVRPGTRRALADPTVVYVWPDLMVPQPASNGLRVRAARLGYLGCADSPVRCSVSTEGEPPADETRAWVPSDAGTTVLPVPWLGFRQALDEAFERWSDGQQLRRSWLPTHYARYRSPEDLPSEGPRPTVFWLRFGTPVPGRRVLAVTEALRNAVLTGYQAVRGIQQDEVPRVLHGHGYTGRGHQHAHWLALPTVGGTHPDGMIRGAAVWLPPDTDPTVSEAVSEALGWLTARDLGKAGYFTTRLGKDEGRSYGRRWTTNPRRWEASARHWTSAYPVVHERWQPGGPDHDEVALWCQHAGVDIPLEAFRVAKVPFLKGALALAPSEASRNGPRYPYSHLDLIFARAVRGPLILGRGRQFGLGLMVPLPEEESRG